MNYLAHIFLSGRHRQVQIGNFVGDAVKGLDYLQYPPEFQRGMLLHRKIDAFADAHPDVREAIKLGKPLLGRYTGVVMDIFFDYFLASDFEYYAGVSLRRYASGFYLALLWYYHYLPDRFKGFLWHFIGTNRLYRYASYEGIRQSLEIMVSYRGLKVDPEEAIDFLVQYKNKLQELFRHFFPQLQEMCREELLLTH